NRLIQLGRRARARLRAGSYPAGNETGPRCLLVARAPSGPNPPPDRVSRPASPWLDCPATYEPFPGMSTGCGALVSLAGPPWRLDPGALFALCLRRYDLSPSPAGEDGMNLAVAAHEDHCPSGSSLRPAASAPGMPPWARDGSRCPPPGACYR